MTLAIFSQAFQEYLRPKRMLPWVILSLLCLGLAMVWKRLDTGANTSLQYGAVSLILVYRVVALASAIYTTAIISQEVEQKTIVYLLTRPVPRWQLLLTRYLASVGAVILIGIFASLLTSFGAYGTGFASNPALGRDLLALSIGAFAYGALFLFVTLLFNRALIICALFAFGWEAAVPNLPGEMFRLSIASYLQGVANHPKVEGQSNALALLSGTAGNGMIDQTTAYGVLAALTVVMLALSSWWFTHFEFVPREDAE